MGIMRLVHSPLLCVGTGHGTDDVVPVLPTAWGIEESTGVGSQEERNEAEGAGSVYTPTSRECDICLRTLGNFSRLGQRYVLRRPCRQSSS